MKNNTPIIFRKIIENDMCTGCGICTYACPSHALKMDWNKYGFLEPKLVKNCDGNNACINVCPFNPNPEPDIRSENELADIFIREKGSKHHVKIGYYKKIYAGFSNQYRLNSSSGGLATYVSYELLQRGIVNHILVVKSSKKENALFEYDIISKKEDIVKASKTKYYPTSLADVFSQITKLEGKIAITGIPCHLKAVRLAQREYPTLSKKIQFLIGIICGGVKSKFYTDYLSQKTLNNSDVLEKYDVNFRLKNIDSTAIDYSFELSKNNEISFSKKMKEMGEMWGTGLFKANACDFCDDVSAELADISLGDAWIPPFLQDGKGTNVIIARTEIANSILKEGIQNNELVLHPISEQKFMLSQKGSYTHRQDAINYRIKRNPHKEIQKKRFNNKLSFDQKLVQRKRLKIRHKSLVIWEQYKNYQEFDKRMKVDIFFLRFITKLNHIKRKLFKS